MSNIGPRTTNIGPGPQLMDVIFKKVNIGRQDTFIIIFSVFDSTQAACNVAACSNGFARNVAACKLSNGFAHK